MRRFDYSITSQHQGKKVEEFLKKEHGYSKRIITRLKHEPKHILKNGVHTRMVDILALGDVITVILTEEQSLVPNADLNVGIIYEDDDVIVFNKPYNMPVHPSILHYEDTLGNFFAYHMQKQNLSIAFRPINRLDRDTTGLCLVAKNSLSANKLSQNVKKVYTAVVCGVMDSNEGIIDAPIGRVNDSIIKREVREDGQDSITEYKVTKVYRDYTQLEINLKTGRTHQIRVHFSYLGYPLAGDELYGGSQKDIKRHALCCSELIFTHPMTEKNIHLKIELDEDITKIMEKSEQ